MGWASLSMLSGGQLFAAMLKPDNDRGPVNNESLSTIREGHPGNMIVNGRFVNEDRKKSVAFSDVLRWRFSANPLKEKKENDKFSLNVISNPEALKGDDDRIVWLGHSTYFIRVNGITFLTDPCLTNPPLVKRRAGLPIKTRDISGIDYLLVSHTHMDHLDSDSLISLDLRGTTALVPLGAGETITFFNNDVKVQEAGWYQKFDTAGDVEIFFMPAHHWSGRTLFDRNRSLWGSYVIRWNGRSIFFAGDTAFSSHFSRIREHFPDIDICLMPIGAYRPAFVMKPNHMNPKESIKAFNILGGKTFVPMHYGTFDLADEPPGEPLQIVNRVNKKGGLNGRLKVLDVGEVMRL